MTENVVHPDLPGTSLNPEDMRDADIISKVTKRCRLLCGWQHKTFPGCMPVTLNYQSLQQLVSKPFVVCEKTDGLRYLLLTAKNGIYLIDRSENVQIINMLMPRFDDPNIIYRNTLLDGELVLDKCASKPPYNNAENNQQEYVYRYLVYDAITIGDEWMISQMNLLDRLRRVYSRVIIPRLQYERRNVDQINVEKSTNNYLQICLKDFFEISDLNAVWNLTKRLPHMSDGVVFTPVDVPYVPGTCDLLLKWKPPELNTVDFVAKAFGDLNTNNIGVGLYVSNRGVLVNTVCFWMGQTDEESFLEWYKLISQNEQCIVESRFSTKGKTVIPSEGDGNETTKYNFLNSASEKPGGWFPERIRTDRPLPNDLKVVARIVKSIEEGISYNMLLKSIILSRQSLTSDSSSSLRVSKDCYLPDYYFDKGGHSLTTSNTNSPPSGEQKNVPRAALA